MQNKCNGLVEEEIKKTTVVNNFNVGVSILLPIIIACGRQEMISISLLKGRKKKRSTLTFKYLAIFYLILHFL